MERKQQNDNQADNSQSAANQFIDMTSVTESFQPPTLQLKANSHIPNSDQEMESGEFQFKKKEYSTNAPESPDDSNNGSNLPFQLQSKPNKTGLSDNLKSGIENLSGFSMDDVKVHYNSNKPAQLQAHAYAQGTDIHIGPGQEKHLPHEAWHVVQQKQGRVKPTTQLKAFNINDDARLEKEADVMGDKALQGKMLLKANSTPQLRANDGRTIQRKVIDNYSSLINKPLTKRWNDWAITNRESLRVIRELMYHSDDDLLDTYNRMQRDGLWSVLYEQAPKHNKDWHDLRWRLTRLGQPVLRNKSEDKRLAKLHSALSASKRAVQATMLVTKDTKVLAKMKETEKYFGLAASTLKKGMEIESGAKAIYKLSRAASKLNNVREDRYAAAQEFGNLLSAAGELGELFPIGPLKGYFTFLGSAEDFFVNMTHKMDFTNMGGGRFRWIGDTDSY